MHDLLTITGLLLLSYSFWICRPVRFRRIGIVLFIGTSALATHMLTGCHITSFLSVLALIALPLVAIAKQTRCLHLPMSNILCEESLPPLRYFPRAKRIIKDLESYGFEPCSQLYWQNAPTRQHIMAFCHPHLRLSATVTFCIKNQTTHAYFSIIGRTTEGLSFHTSNLPRSVSLQLPPEFHLTRLRAPFDSVRDAIDQHHTILKHFGIGIAQLNTSSPKSIPMELAEDKNLLIQHNLKQGIITAIDEQCGKYSFRGQLFLWRQSLKDLLRIC